MDTIRNLVSGDFKQVNDKIIQQLHSRVELVEDIGHYITEAGGKRLRPMLTLLAANACNYQGQKHIDLAVIIEFIHTATLLHDDVVDISMLRRGRPTANANWGNASSILVGDFIYSRAFQMLVELEEIEVMALLSDTTNQIAEGEVLQLSKAGNPDTSREEYMQVIRDKTAILFAAAMKGAAIIAEASEDQQQALYDYGLNLGIAFQLADDILDYKGDAETMGKNVGDDLAEGKPTLPLIYTMESANDDDAKLVREAIVNKDASQIKAIINIVQNNGALDHAHDLAGEYVTRAKESLAIMPDSKFRQGLVSLAEFSLNRSF